ncbi:putative MFS family arabinose efflux permease [Paenibacillus cellulosilyticus]|uniref:Putative MFS family arabinose efflux permease n=1 Tax=Paenibacillus cellulosilyticus TaxID=375489 RepID=A0A2V2YYQ8_9BACL|nr:MFS transporter [Paenibacillus cellulosilyticus]PWW07494.1 putative MFS family arabinose efflux permease [Paenibacillus cellulosilyticus]QKS44352.1 MFS transporter [Paenibacillus cellulosilyticus]
MKTAVWLYLFLFIAFFDLHAQYPILTPFAVSLGAAPSFIGLMMGIYSITHLPGNLIAGVGVDRFGSRLFIVMSLLLAGIVLLLQAHVTNPWQLLALRSVSGFVLAFLSPACMAMLARIATDRIQQGKLMAGNGLVHTFASVFSPAAGALLVAQIGFTRAFEWLGWLLIATAICALLFIHERKVSTAPGSIKMTKNEGSKLQTEKLSPHPELESLEEDRPLPWLVYVLPIATSCAQGILSFELPLMADQHGGHSIMTTGLLFSVVSFGALVTLSMLFLNKYSPYLRTLWGSVLLAMIYFALAVGVPFPLASMLFMLGMAKGIIWPAVPTLLIDLSGGKKYGRTFSLLSIAYSVGAFLGPMAAGILRDRMSPYFIAFFVLMTAAAILPFHGPRRTPARTHFS